VKTPRLSAPVVVLFFCCVCALAWWGNGWLPFGDDGRGSTSRLGYLERSAVVHTGGISVYAVAFSPDGQQLAYTSSEGGVHFTSVEDDVQRSQILGDPAEIVRSLAFQNSGQWLLSGSRDGRVCTWSLPDGHLLRSVVPFNDEVLSLAVSPDSRTIAAASINNLLRLIDATSGKLVDSRFGSLDAWSVSFSPDGATLAVGSFNGTLHLLDLRNQRIIRETATGHSAIKAAVFNNDGDLLYSVGYDGKIRTWEVSTLKPVAVIDVCEKPLYSLSICPEKKLAVTGGYDGNVYVASLRDGKVSDSVETPRVRHGLFPTLSNKKNMVYGVAIRPGGDLIAAGLGNGMLCLWRVKDDAYSAK
jgi:WD40 repeat protein